MIDGNSIINSLIRREAVHNVVEIWGPSKENLKEKITWSRLDPFEVSMDIIYPVPPEILEDYRSVTIGIDVINVNGVPFLVIYNMVENFGTTIELHNIKVRFIVSVIIKG